MSHLQRLLHTNESATLGAVRASQALVISAVDHVVRATPGLPRLLADIHQFLATSLADEPTRLIDTAYTHAHRLLSLHQEFAHRVMEALDVEDHRHNHAQSAEVIPLASRRRPSL